MTTGENAEGQVVASAEVITEPSKDSVPPVDVASLQSQLATLNEQLSQAKRDAEKWQTESKTHQQNVSKKAQEAEKAKQALEQIASLNSKVDIIADALADMAEKRGEDVESQPQKPSLRERIKATETSSKHQQAQEDYNRQANELYAEAQELFANDETKLALIENSLMAGNVARAKKLVESAKKEKPVETKEVKQVPINEMPEFKKAFDDALKAEMKKRGMLESDTGGASGAKKTKTPTLDELRAASPEETEKKVNSGEWSIPGWRV